jgi:hypothetical protein
MGATAKIPQVEGTWLVSFVIYFWLRLAFGIYLGILWGFTYIIDSEGRDVCKYSIRRWRDEE